MRKKRSLFLSSCPEINTGNGGVTYKQRPFLAFYYKSEFFCRILTYSFCVKEKGIANLLLGFLYKIGFAISAPNGSLILLSSRII